MRLINNKASDGLWILTDAVVGIELCVPRKGYENEGPIQLLTGQWLVPPSKVLLKVRGIKGVVELEIPTQEEVG